MNTFMLFIFITLGFLFMGLHSQMLPTFRDHLALALSILADFSKRALKWARGQVSHNEELSSRQAVAQVAGAFLMGTAVAVFTLCELEVSYATLSKIMKLNYSPIFSGSIDWMMGVSTLLLTTVFGVILTDLMGWTFVTRFALIGQGRVAAFCITMPSLVMLVALFMALAYYRGSALEGGAATQNLPTMILVSLAALLAIGVAFAFCSFEDFFSSVTALAVAVVAGLGLVVWLALKLADFVAESVQKWIDRPRSPGLMSRLSRTVDRTPKKLQVHVNGSKPSGESSHNPEASALVGPNSKNPGI